LRINRRYGVTVGIAVTSLGIAAIVATIQHPAPAKARAAALTQAAAASGQTADAAQGGTGQTAATGQAGIAHATVSSGPFVALGDSYAAGNLIPASPTGSPAGCLRSTHNYSDDTQAAIRATSYIDAACSGATTADMTQSQSTAVGVNPPQFDALAADDSLVTITIGGNDVGFSSILEECATLSATNPFGNPCQQHYTVDGTDQLAAAVAATGPKVAAVLQGIHSRAPEARILLVGYPDILPNTGTGCWPTVPLAHGDVPYLRATEVALNQTLAQEAAANGATFVDTYTATIGHDACQRPGVKWVEGLVPTSPAYPFHPNQLGQQAMANQVLATLDG
jgi:lysophospholipase L1-like esterase